MLRPDPESGKDVGLVIPTLLSWGDSAVIRDIKGENWQLTAGWRATFSHCLLFNPTDGSSARYNPLLEVRKGANEVRGVQNVADILVDPEGALERRTIGRRPATRSWSASIGATKAKQVIDGRTYQRWSRHRTAQNPWRVGVDGLDTHVFLIED